MPFQLKEHMKIAPICRRPDLLNMSPEEVKEFLNNMDQHVFNDQVSFFS